MVFNLFYEPGLGYASYMRGNEGEQRKNAGTLCRTLREKRLPLPYVQVFPANVAASLCDGMCTWHMTALPPEFMSQWTAAQLHAPRREQSKLFILDVRQPTERHEDHIPGAPRVSGSELPAKLDRLPKNTPMVVYCGNGYRSSVAASLFMKNGHKDAHNLIGGFSAWQAVPVKH